MRRLAIVIALATALLGAYAVISTGNARAFCSIRFGPINATEAVFACDNDTLLVYRNGDMASKPEEYLMQDGKLLEDSEIPPFSSGDKTYTITQCYEHLETEPSPRHSLMIHATVLDGETQYKQYCDVVVSQDRQQLNRAHFDGPLSVVPQAFDWVTIKKPLVIGGEPTDLRVVIGSFDKPAGCWTVIESGTDDNYNFPNGVAPVASVEFPTEKPDSPIVKRFRLDQFC